MNGSESNRSRRAINACHVCGLYLEVTASGAIPWHFDMRPLRGGLDRKGCPASNALATACYTPPATVDDSGSGGGSRTFVRDSGDHTGSDEDGGPG